MNRDEKSHARCRSRAYPDIVALAAFELPFILSVGLLVGYIEYYFAAEIKWERALRATAVFSVLHAVSYVYVHIKEHESEVENPLYRAFYSISFWFIITTGTAVWLLFFTTGAVMVGTAVWEYIQTGEGRVMEARETFRWSILLSYVLGGLFSLFITSEIQK